MNIFNELIVVTTLETSPIIKKSLTKTQLYSTFQPSVYPISDEMNLSQTIVSKNYSHAQSNPIMPFIDVSPRPMRDLDSEELAKYNAFIDSKKKIIKKSIL
ncbi:hypothetical protein [Leptospira alexanderi]|uniref:hypothetical protein n=1 Tax=Leptospira alexanderi TaxID=100053 RepID=UPI00099143FE|nr:hypothetical protein [Leptospira alexanderi]